MIDAQRLAYLEALEIPVWRPRDVAAPSTLELELGPGSSGILSISAARELQAGGIASDIVRALPETPVWAWPVPAGTGQAVTRAVDQHLFTTLLIFGGELARRLLGQPLPERIEQARLVVVPELEVLARDAAARRELWRLLCAHHLTAAA